MPVHKYGIVIHQRNRDDVLKWAVAMLDSSVERHGRIDVPSAIFNFHPEPGVSVKLKFDNDLDDLPSMITKCGEYEWIRDVEVINRKAVIFIIVNLLSGSFDRVYYKEGTNVPYYIIQNDDTDFRRIAIPKKIMDEELNNRSLLQKPNEPFVYRVGVCSDPFVFVGGSTVHWRYYPDFPLVPIFELYFRDSTLPYLSDSMTYGVLEGIVIAKNETGVLFWTKGMGCAVLSNVTLELKMPTLGSVNFVLVKRCLPEKSFGFSCSYEILPETKRTSWDGLKIISDEINGCVYIEACCPCVLMNEADGPTLAMEVPHIGIVYRGLKRVSEKLIVGKTYHFRIKFQRERDSYVPVVCDICSDQDQFVKCRVAYISEETKTFFAVLEPDAENFQRIKDKIDFIAIPFRVLFCAQGLKVEKEELLIDCYTARVRQPRVEQDLVEAVHVQEVTRSPKNSAYSVFNKTVWLRQLVKIRNAYADNIDMMSSQLCQVMNDFSRLTAGKPVGSEIAVQAQFVLVHKSVPAFWVRDVAPTVHQLPRITLQKFENLPTVQEALPLVSSCDIPTQINVTGIVTIPSVFSNDEEQTIPNNTNLSRQQRDRIQRTRNITEVTELSQGVIATESWFDSSTTSSDGSRASTFSDDMSAGQVITESHYASSIESSAASSLSCDSLEKSSAINISRMSVHGSPPRSRPYGTNCSNQSRGFGPPSYQQDVSSPMTGRNRMRPVKYGYRQLKIATNHRDVLDIMAYRFRERRPMFVENENDALFSWFRMPLGKLTSTKKNLAFVIPVEMTSYKRDYDRKFRRYTALVRFVVTDKLTNVCDASVVVPVGGDFPKMPKDFQLGERYKVEHFSFAADRMCRFGGFAKALNQVTFYAEAPLESITDARTRRNCRGHEYLQFKENVVRPCTPELPSSVFELWSCEHLPGYVIVEKRPDLMKCLEPIDPEVDDEHIYSAFIEPLAGGPVEASIMIENLDEEEERMGFFVFWRLVVEFSDVVPTVPMPVLVSRREKYVPPPTPTKRYISTIPVKDYGMWKTLRINSQLAQQKMDQLRALGDPRIKMLDGPDLKPEIEVRKVDVDSRRDSMFKAMEAFIEHLPKLHEDGLFLFVSKEDVPAKMEKLKVLTDNFHPHQFKKRNYSLEIGLNYLTKILLDGNSYRLMNENRKHIELLRTMADCIGMNTTYIKKTEEAKKMILFFRKQNLNSYI